MSSSNGLNSLSSLEIMKGQTGTANNGQTGTTNNGQNSGNNLVPGWTGSVNLDDFAFSMSEKELAELNRIRQVCCFSTSKSNVFRRLVRYICA